MTDKVSKEVRSKNMQNIKGKDTTIEILVRKWLFKNGFRYRKNDKRFPGTPDLVLPKYKTIVFIHGCFWHGHGICSYSHIPKTRPEYWIEKINRNIERDKKNIDKLKELGWNVEILWECELRKNPDARLNSFANILKENINKS